jgi:hypothetical protein
MSVCPRTLVVTDRYTSHKWAGLALVLFLCLIPRFYAIAHTEVIQRDGVTFIRFARALASDPAGAVVNFDQHPGYSFLLASIHRLVFGSSDDISTWEHTGQLISLAAGTLATVGIWWLGGLMINWRAAWVGAGLFAVSRKWTMLGADVMSDALMLCFWVFSLVAVTAAAISLRSGGRIGRGLAGCALAGSLGGLAYLVRPEGAGAVVVGVGVLLSLALTRAVPLRRIALPLIALLIPAALVASLYAASIGGLTKKKDLVPLVPTVSTEGPLLAGSAGWPVMLRTTDLPLSAGRGPAADFPAPLALVAQTTEALGTTVTVLVGLFLLATLLHFSVPLSWRKPFLAIPTPPGRTVLLLVVALYVPVLIRLHATAGYLDWRHCMPIAFVLVPLAGAGLIALTDLLAHAASPLRLKSLSVPRFVLIQWCWVYPAVVLAAGFGSFRPLHAGNSYVLEAAELLQEESRSVRPMYLVTNLNWVLHYSGVPGRVLDSSRIEPEAYLARLAELDPRPTHLAISDRWLLPTTSVPLTERLREPEFVLLATFRPHDDTQDLIRVYRVSRPN